MNTEKFSVARAQEMRAQGLTYAAIGEHFGVTKQAVHAKLKGCGVQPKPAKPVSDYAPTLYRVFDKQCKLYSVTRSDLALACGIPTEKLQQALTTPGELTPAISQATATALIAKGMPPVLAFDLFAK